MDLSLASVTHPDSSPIGFQWVLMDTPRSLEGKVRLLKAPGRKIICSEGVWILVPDEIAQQLIQTIALAGLQIEVEAGNA